MLVYTGGVTYVYAPVVLTVPPFPFVILTQVDPTVPEGVTAVSEDEDPNVTLVAGLPPIVTANELPELNPVPAIVTA